jgi:hypothetical protein
MSSAFIVCAMAAVLASKGAAISRAAIVSFMVHISRGMRPAGGRLARGTYRVPKYPATLSVALSAIASD